MRNFKNVPRVVFGRGAFQELPSILAAARPAIGNGPIVYLVDGVFKKSAKLGYPLPKGPDQIVRWLDTSTEPKTGYIDQLAGELRALAGGAGPAAVVGIGGGSTMDITKAVAIMLTNPGSCTQYQGWDLVTIPPRFMVGIPTLSGTGAEVSRTCVLTSPEKKQGINSDHSVFHQIVLDPQMIAGAPREQRFYTGMDCYIHSVESLRGTWKNAFSKAYAEKALAVCLDVFLGDGTDDDLMTASYFGGCSIVYAEVGVCHALSYGLSLLFGTRHGEANCIVFDQLGEYYPQDVPVFRSMLKRAGVELRRGVLRGVTKDEMDRMVATTLKMEKPLSNALGPDWRSIMTEDRIRDLYSRM